jgi:hypothetical protein
MSKKNLIALSVALLVVASFYAYLYKDSFRKDSIQISHAIRPNSRSLSPQAAKADAGPLNVITFRLGHDYRVTSLKVISVAELETNKYPHPLWEMLADSNSPPLQVFSYGARIPGMHPAVKDAEPTELAVNTPYRLIVEAGSLKGQHDFTLTAANRVAE